jgi:hypothetical protein
MTGFRSKREMNNIRWLGPYEPQDRHADRITLDHIIKLQKRMSEVEEQMKNTLDMCVSLIQTDRAMRTALAQIASADDWSIEKIKSVAEEALK